MLFLEHLPPLWQPESYEETNPDFIGLKADSLKALALTKGRSSPPLTPSLPPPTPAAIWKGQNHPALE